MTITLAILPPLPPTAPDHGPDAASLANVADHELVMAREWLNRMIPTKGTVTVVVDRALAQACWERNTSNRPFLRSLSDRYAAEAEAGEMVNTGEPIIFSDNGQLSDGQHRLDAVRRTGIEVEVDIRFGVPRSAFAKTNTGRTRRNSDALSIAGHRNAVHLATIAYWVNRMETGEMLCKPKRFLPRQALSMVEQFPDLGDSLAVARPIAAKYHLSLPLVAAVYWRLHHHNPEAAELLFRRLRFELECRGPTDPPFLLHRLYTKMMAGTVGRRDSAAVAAFMIKAFNLMIHGIRRTVLMWRAEDEGFPEVGAIPPRLRRRAVPQDESEPS